MRYNDTAEQVSEYWAQREEEEAIAYEWAIRLQESQYYYL